MATDAADIATQQQIATMSRELELMRAELEEVRAREEAHQTCLTADLAAAREEARRATVALKCSKAKLELANIRAILTTLFDDASDTSSTASTDFSDAGGPPNPRSSAPIPTSVVDIGDAADKSDEDFVNVDLFATALITEDWGKDTHDYFMVAAHMLQRCFMSHVAHSRDFKQLNLTLDGHGELDRNVVRMSKCFEEPMDRFDFTFVPTEGDYYVWTIKVFSPNVEIQSPMVNPDCGKKLWDLAAPKERRGGLTRKHGSFRLFSLGEFDGKKVRFDERVSMRSLVLQSLMAHHYHEQVTEELNGRFRMWAQRQPSVDPAGSGILVEGWFDAQTNLDSLVKEHGTDLTAKGPHAAAATDMHEAATAAAAPSVHGDEAAAS